MALDVVTRARVGRVEYAPDDWVSIVDRAPTGRSGPTTLTHPRPIRRASSPAKGKEAKLSYSGHVLMENRNGLAWTFAWPRPPGARNERRRWRCCVFQASCAARPVHRAQRVRWSRSERSDDVG